jgi:hypothetical protein
MNKMEPIRDPEVTERFRWALDLSETGILIMKQNLRRRYPQASEREISDRLAAWIEKRPFVEPTPSKHS